MTRKHAGPGILRALVAVAASIASADLDKAVELRLWGPPATIHEI
jgi:hypothetical protein